MRYRITHTTRYSYAEPAYESFNEVRLQPCSDASQHCLDFGLNIDPPASVMSFHDYYGNHVHDFGIPYLHTHVTIEATSDVVTYAPLDRPTAGPAGDDVDRSLPLTAIAADAAFADEQAEFLTSSAYIGLDDQSGDLARSLRAEYPDATTYAYFRRAGRAVNELLEYRLGSTTVHSTVAEVLRGGSGVCQDFAHVLISLCRYAGLPARYVSGYLGNVAASGASHAWAEAFIHPYGWIGLDATIGLPCTGRHVKVAVGRDYADVTVVRGSYRGGSAASLEVAVTSTVLDDGPATALLTGTTTRRGDLMQFQMLGALKQFQRLGAMSQSLAAMVQTIARPAPGGQEQIDAPDAPRQQPRQQQQAR